MCLIKIWSIRLCDKRWSAHPQRSRETKVGGGTWVTSFLGYAWALDRSHQHIKSLVSTNPEEHKSTKVGSGGVPQIRGSKEGYTLSGNPPRDVPAEFQLQCLAVKPIKMNNTGAPEGNCCPGVWDTWDASILGLHKAAYEMCRRGTKGRERGGLRWPEDGQGWENREVKG